MNSSAKVIRAVDTISVEVRPFGCKDPNAYNFNPKSALDDGSCIPTTFVECVESKLFSVSLRDCSSKDAKRALKLYTIFQSYVQSVLEGNQKKIDTYSKQIADMCNAEYCETC